VILDSLVANLETILTQITESHLKRYDYLQRTLRCSDVALTLLRTIDLQRVLPDAAWTATLVRTLFFATGTRKIEPIGYV
jgi:hypothetical protein